MGRDLVEIKNFNIDIVIDEIISCSNLFLWSAMEKGKLSDLLPLKFKLFQYDNGNYLIQLEDSRFIEFKTKENKIQEKTKQKHFFEITFSNGNKIQTGFNGTLEEAKEYYLNNEFNLGNASKDVLVKAINITEIN